MRLDGARKWYAGAALASVLVLLAGWFLLVSPQRQNADAIGEQADNQLAANAQMQAKIDALKAQYTNMPALQQQLALVQTRIPQTPGMPSLLRSLSDAAKSAGVTLTAVTPVNPTPLAAAAGGAVQGAPGGAGLTSPGQVNVIGVTLNVAGPFANTRLFLSSLEAMPRAFLVTGLTIARDAQAGKGVAAASGASGTVVPAGTLDSTITGRVFTSNPVTTAATAASTVGTTGAAAGAASQG